LSAFAAAVADTGVCTGWLGAVAAAVSWVAVCSGAAVVAEGAALSFFPQPVANIATPQMSARYNPFWCVNWCHTIRTEPENVFISKWCELVYI
jgi:hypothetical protein